MHSVDNRRVAYIYNSVSQKYGGKGLAVSDGDGRPFGNRRGDGGGGGGTRSALVPEIPGPAIG